MRVAFVSLRAGLDRESDLTRRMRRTAERLSERGHDVTVLCSQWWDGHHPTFVDDDLLYQSVTADAEERAFAAKLPLAVRRADPDVVHAGHLPPSQVLAARVGSTLARAPLVVDWYGETAPESTWLWRRAARVGDAVLTPSRTVRTRIRELGADGDAVAVVPGSIDVDLIEDTRAVEDGPDVVYSRRLDEDANVGTLLLALAELRDRDWHTVIVGEGPERERYEQQARDLRIDDRVEFVGDLPLEERVATLRAAHVFVQTARREPFADELLLALACGCVGVVEYQAESSAHELVEHHDRGFRTYSDDELTDRIVAAADLPHREFDDDFAEYDHDAVLEKYLDRYRAVRDEYGLF